MSDPVTQTPPPAPARTAAPAGPRRRRRRWPRVLLGMVLVLLLAAWFAPAIVANTSLRNRLARAAAADLNGTLDVGGASLGWLAPVELRDVTVTDPQGRVVARIPRVTSGKTLLSLVRDHSDVGEFTIDRPEIEIVCGKDSTNLEDVLKKLIEDTAPPGPTRTPVAVRVTGGTLTLKDSDTSRTSEFRDVEATVSVPWARSEPVTAKVTANAPGKIEADASIGSASRVTFTANGFALETLAPLFRRVEPGLTVAGSLAADATATWGADAASIDGTFGVKNLAVASPELKGDTLRLASVGLPLKASVTGRTVRLERAELTTDVGTASVVGTFNPDEPLDKLFDKPGVKLDASVDVARLATLFPKLLRVRDGTEFREGKLTVKVESKAGEKGTAWTGKVTTSALKARRGGKDISWEDPLAVDFVGRIKAGELPTFDRLICTSEFISVNAEVKPNSVRAAANVHLDKLAVRLAEFADIGGISLGGSGSAWVIATRTPAGDFKADGGVDLTQFAFVGRDRKGLREPTLKLQLAATGKAPDGGPVSVSTARVVLTAGTDTLHLTLLEAIPDAKNLAAGKLDAKVTGDLTRWQKRVGVVTPVLDGYVMAGNATAGGTVRFGPDALHVDRMTLSIDNARFIGCALDIDEPSMNAVADLTADLKTGTTTFAEFTIHSAPLSVTRGKLVVESPPGGRLVAYGGGPAVTDLNRLGRTVGVYKDARGPSAMHGRGVGPIHFRYTGDVTTFTGALDVTDFAYGLKAKPDWAEPTMRIELDGSYTSSADAVAFTAAKLERPGLGLAAAGGFKNFDTTTDVNLAGTVTYDMAKLTPLLREFVGGHFAAAGKGTRPVSFVGSLTPPPKPGSTLPPSVLASATGELAVGWDAATAFGFEMGATELRARLANGVVRVAPVSATFAGGKVTAEPTVRLDPAPREATFARGVIVDKAKLTPAVCEGALGFALPTIAKSGKSEGHISMRLDENLIPLANPRQATLKGALIVHDATLAAGPVLTAVAELLGAENGTMTLASEQTVPVRVEQGRVYHENLAVKIGAYSVKTTGSAGFDGTLDLVVDLPIPGGLPGLKNTPAIAKALAGKRVHLPVKGTIDAPKLDPQQFSAAVARLAQDAAKDVGKELLGRELDKLLPGGLPAPGGGGGILPKLPGGLMPKLPDGVLPKLPGGFPFPLPKK